MKPSLIFCILLALCFPLLAQCSITRESRLYTFIVKTDTISGSSGNCHITSIGIYEKAHNRLVQTLTPPQNIFSCSLPNEQAFLLKDIDFDGQQDLMIVQLIPAAPNIPYYYWKYNKKKRQFLRDTTLEDITSPNFNDTDQTITSFWRSSWNHHGVSTYKYINNQVTLVEESESSPNPDNDAQQIFTHKKLVKGNMVLVDKTFDKAEESPNGTR